MFHIDHEQRARIILLAFQRRLNEDIADETNIHGGAGDTVSVDEMPGLQALERATETIPMKPGQPRRIEYEDIRHGTLCLIGNWHIVLGQMISSTIQQTPTEIDFVCMFITPSRRIRMLAGCLCSTT